MGFKRKNLIPKVSIIVPVYNAEKYLKRCLDSLVEQTFSDYEIILIDDSSKDSSIEIMREFEKEYNHIRIIQHKENLGLPSARKSGLLNACGEYIYFVDADDWIENDTLSTMYANAIDGDKDIVYAELDCIDLLGNIIGVTKLEKDIFEANLLTKNARIKLFINEPIMFCGKLYRRDWFINTGIRFMEGASFDEDDVEVLFSLFASKTGCINRPLYHYFNNSFSMSNISGIHLEERYSCAWHIISEAKRLKIYKKYKDAIDFVFYRAFLIGTMVAIIDSKNLKHSDLDILIGYAKETKWNFLENPYILNQLSDGELTLLRGLTSKENFIQSYCMEFGAIYKTCEEKIQELVHVISSKSARTVLWSAGKRSRTLLLVFPELAAQIAYVVDKDSKWRGVILESGKKVKAIEDIDTDICCVIVPRKDWISEIRRNIREDIDILDLMKFLEMDQ